MSMKLVKETIEEGGINLETIEVNDDSISIISVWNGEEEYSEDKYYIAKGEQYGSCNKVHGGKGKGCFPVTEDDECYDWEFIVEVINDLSFLSESVKSEIIKSHTL